MSTIIVIESATGGKRTIPANWQKPAPRGRIWFKLKNPSAPPHRNPTGSSAEENQPNHGRVAAGYALIDDYQQYDWQLGFRIGLILGTTSVGYHAGIAGSKRSRSSLILATSFGLVIAPIASLDQPGGSLISRCLESEASP